MKIALAAVASSPHLSGVSRHAINVARCLNDREEISQIDLLVADYQRPAFQSALHGKELPKVALHAVHAGNSVLSRNHWYLRTLPTVVDRLASDILHYTYPAPLSSRSGGPPTLVTLHDLYPLDIPSNFGFSKVLFNRMILWQCLRSADAIACVSNATASRLEAYAPLLAINKSVIIPNYVEMEAAEQARRPKQLGRYEKFILCVAQHRRNKNLLLALNVFRRLRAETSVGSDVRFVVVGIPGPETSSIQRYIQRSGLSDHVSLWHGLDETELAWCYLHAQLLLAPSICEGFGLPIVEAMVHCCPVVCSDIPAFREVGGAYCHYIALDKDAEKKFAQAVESAMREPRSRSPQTDAYTAKSAAASYVELYGRLFLRHGKTVRSSELDLLPTVQLGGGR